ncbi:MAG: ATP-binding protein [Pseudomonadaceae bacterium]|nr:ATP-binding protein [Pseudomonadaceae bacterium]
MLQRIKTLLTESPNLKGREIAKEIGEDRKAVNAFLHANAEHFVQDDAYCWRLITPPAMEITFEGDQWVDCDSFEASLKHAGSPLDAPCACVNFVLQKKCKILLDAAARFLALCNQLADDGKATIIDFSECKTTMHYFDRIGFFDHLDERVTVMPNRPNVSKAATYKGNSDAVVEFGSVDPSSGNKELINQLTDRFVQQSDERFEAAASTVFGEFIRNVKDHSESKLEGFAALQKYAGHRKHIQTVVSDSGLGIFATLLPSIEAHHPKLFSLHNQADYAQQVVTAVLTQGEISRFGSGRGLGFKSTRKQAGKFNARLSVRQTNFSIDLQYIGGIVKDIRIANDLPTIRGTHLCFDFFVD